MKSIGHSLLLLCVWTGIAHAQEQTQSETDYHDHAPLLNTMLAQAEADDIPVLRPEHHSEIQRKKTLSSGQYDDSPFTGKILFKDDRSGELRLFSMKEGKRHGAQWTFYSDGQAKHLTTLSASRVDGPQKSWYWYERVALENTPATQTAQQRTHLARLGQWDDGKQAGIWKRWDFRGKLYSQTEYEEGIEIPNGMQEKTLKQWRDYYTKNWNEFFDYWQSQTQAISAASKELPPPISEAYAVYDLWRSIDREEAPKIRALAGAGTIVPKYSIAQNRITVVVIDDIDYALFDFKQIPTEPTEKTVYEVTDFRPRHAEDRSILFAERRFTDLLERYGEALLKPEQPQANSVLEIIREPEQGPKEITAEEKLKAVAKAKKEAAKEQARYEAEKAKLIAERRQELSETLAPWVAHRLDDDGRFSIIYNAVRVIVFNKTLDEAVLFTRVRFAEPNPTVFLKKDKAGDWQLYGAALPGVSSQIVRPEEDTHGILSLFTEL